MSPNMSRAVCHFIDSFKVKSVRSHFVLLDRSIWHIVKQNYLPSFLNRVQFLLSEVDIASTVLYIGRLN